MSRGLRIGLLLVAVLVVANLGLAAKSWQEAEVGWDPITCQTSYTDEVMGMFIFGTPFTALVSLAILRRRNARAVVHTLE